MVTFWTQTCRVAQAKEFQECQWQSQTLIMMGLLRVSALPKQGTLCIIPAREIQTKLFANTCEKHSEILANVFANFRA